MLEKLTCSYVTDCGRADVLEKLGVVIDLESEVRNWYLVSLTPLFNQINLTSLSCYGM